MTGNTITDLRTHLFDTLRALKDKDDPMDIELARAVSEIAQVIINSAKAEVEYLKVAGGRGSGFIPEAPALPGAPTTAAGETIIEQRPGVTVKQHRLK